MLFLIISPEVTARKKRVLEVVKPFSIGDAIVLDDVTSTFFDLGQYRYPSLFSLERPVVRASFLLDTISSDVDSAFIVSLVESPTVFVLEEHALSATDKKRFEKEGALVSMLPFQKKTAPPTSALFSVVTTLTLSSDRKEKWMVLQRALTEESAEALIGMWYWKLRDVIQKNPKERTRLRTLYRTLIDRHAHAWMHQIPLALVLEKIVLET